MPAFAARLFFKLDVFDRHGSVDGFAHVIDSKCGDRNAGKCFHFDSGLCGIGDGAADVYG